MVRDIVAAPLVRWYVSPVIHGGVPDDGEVCLGVFQDTGEFWSDGARFRPGVVPLDTQFLRRLPQFRFSEVREKARGMIVQVLDEFFKGGSGSL